MIWANLLHLSTNMWADNDRPDLPTPHWCAKPYLRFENGLWTDITGKMGESGFNMVVIDVGDGIQFASHPELAVQGAWSREKLKAEIMRLRGLGLEPIPKLNFSAAHDAWMGPYSRMVSSPTYYEVCRDLIAEVCELFEKPRFFHIGMDEEFAHEQVLYEYVVMRQDKLWWHDLYFYIEEVEKNGSRAWMWSDYMWHHPREFAAKMPKTVVQSNWYYNGTFDLGPVEEGTVWSAEDSRAHSVPVDSYRILEAHGFDQIPTGSNWCQPDNMELTVKFCQQNIAPERLLGFLMAPWFFTLEEFRERHFAAIDQVHNARKHGGE